MSAHSSSGEEKILGVTEDPVLRPVGTLMVLVGGIWLLFGGMALEAGTFTQPLLAVLLVVLGMLTAGAGKEEVQI